MARAFLSVLFLLLLAAPAWAGPFGTEMGDKPEKYQIFVDSGYFKLAKTMPKQHSAFDQYFLCFGAEGLEAVSGSTEKSTNIQEILKSYETLKAELQKKYGDPADMHEYLSSEKEFQEQIELLKGALSGERKHETVWNKNLPDNLADIKLWVAADSDRKKLGVMLLYRYKNFKSDNQRNMDAL